MILAAKHQNERGFLNAVAAANSLEGCHCYPVFFKDEQTGRYDLQHLPLCQWAGPHPLTHWMTGN